MPAKDQHQECTPVCSIILVHFLDSYQVPGAPGNTPHEK